MPHRCDFPLYVYRYQGQNSCSNKFSWQSEPKSRMLFYHLITNVCHHLQQTPACAFVSASNTASSVAPGRTSDSGSSSGSSEHSGKSPGTLKLHLVKWRRLKHLKRYGPARSQLIMDPVDVYIFILSNSATPGTEPHIHSVIIVVFFKYCTPNRAKVTLEMQAAGRCVLLSRD